MPTRLLLAVLFALILAACGPRNTQPPLRLPTAPPAEATSTAAPPAAPATPDWTSGWLRGEPCAPPCYMGVTPGALSPTQALALFQSTYPTLNFVDYQPVDDLPSTISTDWRRTIAPSDSLQPPFGNSIMRAYYYTQTPPAITVPTNTIIAISVHSDDLVRPDEIIAAFGEPSHALAVAEALPSNGSQQFYSVVYLERGLMVDYDLSAVNIQQTRLEPTYLRVIGLTFFTPTLAGFNDAMRAFYPVRMETPAALLVPWEGYKRFGFYCQEANPLPDQSPCL